MAEPSGSIPTPQRLRSIDELSSAHEWLFEQSRNGRIDNKTADVLNTTLKGATFLNGKLKLEYAKLYMQSQVKKFEFPKGVLPVLEP
jgi:hypothetical protein